MASTTIDLHAAGIKADGRCMENGERRFRLQAPDGSAYIRTEAGAEGGWQNAHHHKGITEVYVVQSRCMVVAERFGTQTKLLLVRIGSAWTSVAGQDHNIYLPGKAVIHTLKFGVSIGNPDRKGDDWYPAQPTFDAETKAMSLPSIAESLGVNVYELVQ